MLRFIFVLVFCSVSLAADLPELFAWNEIDFNWPSPEAKEDAIRTGAFIPANNLPLGIERWRNKLFVTVPRWKAGVGSSLNYVLLDEPIEKSAPLTPYPSYRANSLAPNDTKQDDHIVSTFRVRVDACDRLWVMDTGVADVLGGYHQISKPALVIFDLKTDKLIKRYSLKPTDVKDSSFFANVVVDVQPDKCDQAFAYIPDLGGYGLVVYSLASDDSWRIQHNYFHFDPLKGDLNVGGVNFQWTDGIFGLALSDINPDGFRTLYFHPLVSTKEFCVCTCILRNRTAALDPHNYHDFKLIADRGENTQASASDIDKKTGVMFLTQLQKDGVACWNTRKPLTPENFVMLIEDKKGLIFTNDLKVDDEQNLYFLSDKMPQFLFKTLDPTTVNYRIYRVNAAQIIKGTACDN